MRYLELQPHPRLAPFVKCFWIMEDPTAAAFQPLETVIPDGCMELIVHYGSRFTKRLDNGKYQSLPAALIAGQITTRLLLQAGGHVGMISARFHPAGAFPFIRNSLRGFVDDVIPLDAVWNREAVALEERIRNADSDADRVDLMQRYLLRILDGGFKRDAVVSETVDRILASRGRASVGDLARHAHVTCRHLERSFEAEVGISPKLLSRIVRFQRIFQYLQDCPNPSWADAAYACGYFDQAHLIRDFKRFTGQPPLAYLDSRGWMCRCLTQHPL